MEALYGMLGAMVGIALFILGCFFGRAFSVEKKAPVQNDLNETELNALKEERERLIAEQKAFRELMGYNVDTAYGVASGKEQ